MDEKSPIRRNCISHLKQIGADIKTIEYGLWDLAYAEARIDSVIFLNMRRAAKSLLKAIDGLEYSITVK